MIIDHYYQFDNDRLAFTREQASRFAKEMADDFNPLHNIDSKRFCVPGDLLFAVVLARYGLNQHMHFTFEGMVNEDSRPILPPADQPTLRIVDDNNKAFLSIERSFDNSRDPALIDSLTRCYVEFSGHTFPHVLVPLMAEQNVMISPERPMVIYESMTIDLDHLAFTAPSLQLNGARLEVNGKRGSVLLPFIVSANGQVVGRGEKRMLLSGLRPFEKPVMDAIVADYNAWKVDYCRNNQATPA